MTEGIPSLSSDTRALIEHERAVPPLPPAVRARALAAARAALAASVPVAPPPRIAATPWVRWAAAATITCAAGAAVAAVAYRHHLAAVPPGETRPPLAPSAATPQPAPPAAGAPSPSLAPPAVETTRRSRLAPSPDELRLLQQARAAVARKDFAAALPPIAEHARRFKDGRLVEEREALRVKALVGLGRAGEARRAAAAFEARFPHSVLLPAIRGMSSGGE